MTGRFFIFFDSLSIAQSQNKNSSNLVQIWFENSSNLVRFRFEISSKEEFETLIHLNQCSCSSNHNISLVADAPYVYGKRLWND